MCTEFLVGRLDFFGIQHMFRGYKLYRIIQCETDTVGVRLTAMYVLAAGLS